MFEGLKFLFSKKTAIATELDVINHHIESLKFSNDELDNFIKICDRLISSINSLLNDVESKIKNREIDDEKLFSIKFDIERAEYNPNVTSSMLIELRNKYDSLLKELLEVYLNKLKKGTYQDYSLYNKYLDIVSDLQIILNNKVYTTRYSTEAFFQTICFSIIDNDKEITLTDINFVLDKILTFKIEISREYNKNQSNLTNIELSSTKRYYDALEEEYNNKKR